MARNGSGTYALPLADVVAGNTILASWANTSLSDIATALTNSLAKDGQTNPSANLPMNSFRHTGVGVATALTDYARASQVVDGALQALTSVAGTADAITATAPLSVSAYATGQRFSFTASGANTGAATININGIGVKSITKFGSVALIRNDIPNGARILIEYDGTQFQLVNINSGGVGAVTFSGVVSPSQITANQNDYAPTGVGGVAEVRVDGDADRDITGISAGQTDGRELAFTNDGSFTFTLKHADANSTAANRFDLGSGTDVLVASGASVRLRYDGTASRWRLIGSTGLLDEDDLASDSATQAATQQSIKAYVDANLSSITLGTEQASTSGTAITFGSIPSGTKKITVMLEGVSTNGTSPIVATIGDVGGLETSGYLGSASSLTGAGTGNDNYGSNFIIVRSVAAATTYFGVIELYLKDSSNFTWVCSSNASNNSGTVQSFLSAGAKSLSAELTQLSITTSGGSDTFDAGSINIQYE